MNPEQYFHSFVNEAVDKGLKPSQVFNERERIWRENIQPALVKKGANDTDLTNAMKRWQEKTNAPMMQLGFLPKDGQNSRGAAKDLRAERAVRESAKTGSKLPVIKETALSTAETLANAFGQGASQMVGSAARFANDIGDNEKGTKLDQIANFGESNAKAFGKSASSQQNAMQSGEMGKAAQLGIGAVQSIPAMALPAGAAIGGTKAAASLGAKVAAPYLGFGIGAIAGHTQNYGEVRRGATQNLQRDFPNWQKLQGNPLYEQKLNENINAGLDIEQARQRAHADTLDELSESAADKYGTAMTALDVIAPSGAALGSGILKHLPKNKIGQFLAGGSVDAGLVAKELNNAPRVGLAKLIPDTSIQANKAAAKMVAKQGLEEGLQGAVGEYGSQSATANIGGKAVDWKQIGQSFVDEGLIGAVMGGGMQSAAGHSPVGQAKNVAKELRNQTNALRKDEAVARNNLSEAIQFNNPERITEAESDLQLIQERAKNLHEGYTQQGVEPPYFVQRLLPKQEEPDANQDEVAQPEPIQNEVTPESIQPQESIAEQAPEPEQSGFKPVGYDMANTTNLVVKAVSDGVLSLDQAEAIQKDPIVGAVFGHAVNGDKASAQQTIMDAVTQGALDLDKAESLSQSINTFAELHKRSSQIDNLQDTQQTKPTLSSIVDNHIKQQVNNGINQPELSDFGYTPQKLDPAIQDPNLSDFDTLEPQSIQPEQSGIIDQNETESTQDQEAIQPFEYQPDQQQLEASRTVSESQNPATQPEQGNYPLFSGQPTDLKQSFAEKFTDAHLNNPQLKTKLINDEIASGRNRADVLKQVNEIVSAAPVQENKSEPEQANITTKGNQPTEFEASPEKQKSFSNPAKANEYIRKNNLTESHEPVLVDGLYQVKERSATQPNDQTLSINGTLEPEAIGRSSDNKPFANQQSANLALKRKNLQDTHTVVAADGGYVLQKNASESANHQTEAPVVFPVDQVKQAFSHAHLSPANTARSMKESFDRFIQSEVEKAEPLIETEQQQKAFDSAISELEKKYINEWLPPLLNAASSTVSSAVAGRNNFNSKQANRRGSALDRAMKSFDDLIQNHTGQALAKVISARTPEQRQRLLDVENEKQEQARLQELQKAEQVALAQDSTSKRRRVTNADVPDRSQAIEMTMDEWKKKHKDYKSTNLGVRMVMALNKETGGTELRPVWITDEKLVKAKQNPTQDQPQDPKSSPQQEITELENQVTELNEQREKIDAEINSQSENSAKFYSENYRPSPETPLGWKDESTQAQYYSLLKATQKLKEQRSDIDSSLKKTNEKLSLTRNSNDPSLLMREKQRKRELEVTSSTYERAQKRLQKDVENWMGASRSNQNARVQTENINQLDAQANEAATSPDNNVPEPTQAQIEADNYKKGHVKVNGLDISIENPKGSVRSGKRPDGSEWSHTMSDHYGYIKRTVGADNEHIDSYVGSNPDSDKVFIVDQLDQQTGEFDEHKVMLGFNDLDTATKAYQSNFDKDWKVGPIQSMNMNEFKDWLKNGDTTRPTTDIKNFSKNVNENITIQIHSEVGITHNIPENLLDQSHKLGDVVEDLAKMSSDVESDTQYSENLLRKIAKLNPNIGVVFTDDPKLASGLSEGGHYPFSKDGHEKVIIYPQGNWESDILSLVNHELIHAVTHQAIAQNKVSPNDLDFLNRFSESLRDWMFKNPMLLDEWIEYRFDYGINDKYHNELLAVFTAETDVRKALNEIQGQLSYESEEQARNFAEPQKNDNGEFSKTSSEDSGKNERPPAESERSQKDWGGQYQRQIDSNRAGKTRTQVHLLDEFDNVVQRIFNLNNEQREQTRNIKDSKRGRSTEIPSLAEREANPDTVSTKRSGISQNTERSVKNLAENSRSLDTVFGVLPQSRAIERVISFLDHLKMPATQDAASRGRFNVHLGRGNEISGTVNHGFTLQVVTSFDDLPKVIQQAATYQDENGKTQNYSVSGVWHDDTLYVVTDQIHGDRAKQFTTSDAYEELLVHEIIGHFGVQQVFGKEYKTKFQQLYNALGGQSGILKIAKDNGVDVKQFKEAYIDPFTKGIKEGYYDPLDVQQATVSELFAFIAQNEKTRPFVQQKLKELLGYIRQWFRDHGLMSLDKYNDADIMMFLAEARKAVVDRDMFGKFGHQVIPSQNEANLGSQSEKIPQFSLNEASHSPFNKAIDDVVAGNTQDRYFNMGSTPDVLKMLGLPDTKVTINGKTIEKVMAQYLGISKGEHSNIHNLTPDTLRQLPRELNNPVAVFKSGTDATRQGYIVLTELTEKDVKTGVDKPVIAALHLNKTRNGVELVNIASVYGRSKQQMQNSMDNDLLYWHKEKGQNFVNAFGLQLPSHMQIQKTDQTKGLQSNVGSLQLQPETHSSASLSKANIKTNEDLVKYQSIPKFSRKLAANPEDLPESTQQKILDAASKSFFGQAKLLGLERSKTISKQTGRLFNTMLHKALQDKDFKVTFDLVQDKINHVTFSSSGSMDVAPDILTQLEKGSDYVNEAKKVGQQLAHTVKLRDKPEFQKDLEIVGDILFENTLSEEPKVFSDSELRSKNLTQQQINLYRQARAAVETSLDSFAKTTISNIYKHLGGKSDEILAITAMDLSLGGHVNEIADRMAKIVENDPDKAEAAKVAEEHIEKVVTRLEQLKDEGYMPLMRFGKYYMRVIDPTTKEVAFRQHFESEAERNLFVKNYKAPDGYKVESSQINELEHKLFQGVSPETVALFAKEAGLPVGDAEAAYIKHAVRDNHALKRLLRRQGVQGFNTDTKRVLAAFVLSNARYAANQLYNPAIDESIVEIKDPAYAEDAIRLRDYALDTQEEVAAVKNFAFVWYMGASFMFGVVNMTQPLLQTFPYLLQYSTDAGSVPRAMVRAVKSWYGKEIPTKYQDFYERARREGHLDPQNTWMLQGLERGKSGLGASTWQLISHASGFFAQASETVNRRTALFAALDIAENLGNAKLQKLGFKDAYDFAVRTIQETQGIYNKGNRPRVSRGNVGSLLMMYKQFMISYVEQMVRMQRSGLWGGEDDEFKKRMAKLVGFGISRSMLVALGVLWSFAGATGLPFMRDLLDVIETAGGMVGKPVNTEREVQIALVNALGDTLGTAATTVLLDGPANLNPVIDVKGRMGMGDLIPATAYFSPLTSEWQKSKELAGVGGAIGGLVDKAGSAIDYAQIGAYGQALGQLAPKAFTSLGQGAVAAVTGDYRNMQTGVKTNDATILDGFIKMLDAQPSGIAKEGRVRGLEMKDKAALQYVNKRAKEDYEKVLETGDQKQILEFRKAIEDYNATEPRYPITMNLKRAETNFAKSNMNWQEKRKATKGLDWMDDYNPYLETEQ